MIVLVFPVPGGPETKSTWYASASYQIKRLDFVVYSHGSDP